MRAFVYAERSLNEMMTGVFGNLWMGGYAYRFVHGMDPDFSLKHGAAGLTPRLERRWGLGEDHSLA